MHFKEVYTPEEINKRVQELGKAISHDYRDKNLVAVCVLKGAFVLFADLLRELSIEVETDFIRLSSYADGTSPSGRVLFSKDMEVSVQDRDVLIVEDIVDTGYSINYLSKVLWARQPSSVSVCSLVDKRERREVEVDVRYPGFVLEKGFLVGYGLDYAEKYRAFPGVYEIQFEE